MELLPFLLVVASAFSHASWNVLAKRASDKDAFLWLATFTAFFTTLPLFYIWLENWALPVKAIPYLTMSAVAELFYFLSLSKAYDLGELSVVYPFARASPLFLYILEVLFLGEEVTPPGVSGIILVVLGIYTIHMGGFSSSEFLKPLKSLRSSASRYALLTALCTTAYSLTDKLGVMSISPLTYAFWLDIFILSLLTPVILLSKRSATILAEWRSHGLHVVLAGFLMKFGYIIVLVAMSFAQASYILAVRQLSVVIGVALGVKFLGEKHGQVRVISSILIFTGIVVLGTIV